MNLLKHLLSLCASLIIISCVPINKPIENVKITVPVKRLHAFGYSFVPPNEEGWEISQRAKFLLAIGKKDTAKNEVHLIHGAPLKIPEYLIDKNFIQMIKERQTKEWGSSRYKINKHDVTSYTGKNTTCAHSHMQLEDQEALTYSGNRVFMAREVLSLTCIHPKHPNVAVNVTYSYRHPFDQKEPKFIEKAEKVLSSIEYTSM